MIFEIKSTEDFNTFTKNKGLVVIHFWAEWNLYDKTLKETLRELAIEFGETVKFYSLDIDQEQLFDFLKGLPLFNIPALAYFKDGNKMAFEIGLRKKEYIQNKIEQLLVY